MAKFKIKVSFVQHGVYTIEANCKQQAMNRFYGGVFDNYKDTPKTVKDSEEEVLSVEEIED